MPASYTCLRYHLIFSTKNREPLIDSSWRQRLYDYLGGIARNHGGCLISAGGTDDHVHLLADVPKTVAVADALRLPKTNSSKWVHETIPEMGHFAWQDGYGAFTVSLSNFPAVKEYLARQEEHHRTMTFQEEFRALLNKHEIEFDEQHVWG